MKHIQTLLPASAQGHWVGDGFPVRPLFADLAFSEQISPFLMFDYGGPAMFEPTQKKRGVGAHPHRGFETVTIAFQGEIEHGDSVGNRGVIGPGDVQWMTAASGIVHEEFHSQAFAKQGGMMEMVQLWVNLPAKFKMSPPQYQPILREAIPSIPLADDAGSVRVIAGDYAGVKGPATTFSQINLWDIELREGKSMTLTLPEAYTTLIFVRTGKLALDGKSLDAADLALLTREGNSIELQALKNTQLMVLNGEPINEPIAARGPFVMNSEHELRQAIEDYQSGRMGRLAG